MPERPEVPAVGASHRSLLPVTVTTSEDGHRSTFKFMTGGLARDGMVIEPGGVDVAAYLRNPVVLWSHGFDIHGMVPIGRAENVRPEDDGWAADVVWDDEDEFAARIASKVKRGFVNAVSFGWRTLDAGWETREGKEVYVVRRCEMMEFSPVGVPADADALVMQRALDTALAAEVERLRARVAELETLDSREEPAPRPATEEETLRACAALIPALDTAFLRAMGRA